MGYAEAIEQQMDQVNYWNSPQGLVQATTICHANPHIWNASDAARIRATIAATLGAAEPYYVAPQICDLLYSAAATLPDATLTADLLPAPEGMIFWGKPIPMPEVPDDFGGGDLRVTLWGDARWHSPAAADVNGCVVTDFNVMPEYRLPRVVAQTYWPYGDTLLGWGQKYGKLIGEDEATNLRLVSYLQRAMFMAALLFMKQSILTTSRRPVLNRSARKRIGRELSHEPMVKVVQLRRREYPQRDESHDTHIEYSCQWLVRGHWRQQFFPSTGEHRPLWISPHVKGPADKPLRAPTITAYEVVR